MVGAKDDQDRRQRSGRYNEFVPSKKKELQLQDEQQYKSEWVGKFKPFIQGVKEEVGYLKRDIRKKEYPLTSSGLDSQRLIGEIQALSAATGNFPKYPTEIFERAISEGRIDFASHLAERVFSQEPQNEKELFAQAEFKKAVTAALHTTGVDKMRQELAELEKIQDTAERFVTLIESGLVGEAKDFGEKERQLRVMGLAK
jgi:hypothetical protein